MPRSTGTVDRAQPRAALLSFGRPGGRPLPSCARSCTPVDRAVDRTPPSVDRAADREHKSGLLQCAVSRSLISDLCANFLYSSISSLPQFYNSVKIFKSEPISNELQSITWRNRHTISAKSTHDLDLRALDEIDTRSRRNRQTISAWNL